jgi:hypothetical protein
MSPLPVRPYPYSLDEPLLWLTRKDPWTIRMACEGTQILGDMGSGKTSGSGRTLAKAMLSAGFGGLVLCKKIDECATWVQYAQETGRMDQLLIVDPSQSWRFNFLDYQFRRAGEGAGYVDNAVALFMNLIENRREGAQQTRGRNDAFWVDGARRLVRHTMEALLLAGEPVSMDNLKKAITTLPSANEETGERLWPKDAGGNPTFLARCLGKAVYRHQHGWDAGHLTASTPDDIIEYYESEFARPGANRQSAGILSTWTGMSDPFMAGPIKEIFCTSTNFVPEFSRRGAVIILNFPLDEWEEIGRTAQLAFKYIWQRAVLRRQGLPPGEVPVFLWADEAQNFITTADRAFQEASRSSVCGTVFLTQNINNYFAAFHENAEANANALLAGLALKIFHRQGDHRTNEWAAQTIAQGRVVYYNGGSSESRGFSQTDSWGYSSNWSHSTGGDSGGGGFNSGESVGISRQHSASEGWSQQRGFQVEPEVFTRLKSGGPEHKHRVEAVLFKSGASFAPAGKPFTNVAFRQR